jgi:prevent-host-death family protein
MSATDAARNFSRLLDDVEHHGRSVTILRGGRPVATVIPAAPRTITVAELLQAVRSFPAPDTDLADDLRQARADLPVERDPWES